MRRDDTRLHRLNHGISLAGTHACCDAEVAVHVLSVTRSALIASLAPPLTVTWSRLVCISPYCGTILFVLYRLTVVWSCFPLKMAWLCLSYISPYCDTIPFVPYYVVLLWLDPVCPISPQSGMISLVLYIAIQWRDPICFFISPYCDFILFVLYRLTVARSCLSYIASQWHDLACYIIISPHYGMIPFVSYLSLLWLYPVCPISSYCGTILFVLYRLQVAWFCLSCISPYCDMVPFVLYIVLLRLEPVCPISLQSGMI